MPTFHHDGEDFELVADIDDLLIDDAQILEEELGIDLRDIGRLPFHKMARVFVLLSLRRRRPDATLADAGRVRMAPVIAALAEVDEPAAPAAVDATTNPRGIDLTGTVHIGVAATDELVVDAVDDGEVLSPGSAGSVTSGELPAPGDTPES